MVGPVMAGAKRLMPGASSGQVSFRFSTPAGYPARNDDLAGHILSMELARLVYLSVPVARWVSDDANYFCELKSGEIIGVQDGGVALLPGQFENISGMVGELARMPRGAEHHLNHYDSLAYARSLLHTYRHRFPDFDAVDSALQALRFLSIGQAAPEVLYAIQVSPHLQMVMAEKVRLLQDALGLLEQPVPDRDKVMGLRTMLVPDVMTATEFRQRVWAQATAPFTLEAGKMDKIRAALAAKLEQVQSEM
jgi:hypothetical protein